MDYEALLNRVREKLPENTCSHDRFQMPKLESFIEGSKVIISNMNHVANYLNRDVSHIVKFIARELATPSIIEGGGRVIFNGKFQNKTINEKLEMYVATYVKCKECCSPDTKIEKDERVFIMHCMACQAKRPVPKIK